MLGLGIAIPEIPNMQTATAQKPKDGSTFANIASGISNIFNSAAPVVQAVTKPSGGSASYNPNLPASSGFNTNNPPPPEAAKKNNTVKYALIAVASLGAAFGIYKIATRKKKGVSGVEDTTDSFALNGAKKKKSRKRKK